MEPYTYRPLGPCDIRRFSMERSKDFDAPITGVLRETSVTDRSPYIALSYAWGTTYEDGSHLTESIICENSILRVTPTLKHILRRIRSLRSAALHEDIALNISSLPLWIDALCIDQENLEERSQQVRLMPDIYTQCRFLFIWLGELAVGTLELIPETTLRPPDGTTTNTTTATVRKTRVPGRRRKQKKAIESMLESSWFRRRWVIQEAQNAADEWTYMLMGNTLLRKPRFVAILKDFGLLGHAPPLTSLRSTRSIFELLFLLDSSECNDPRDRLFALISLTNVQERELLDVDYNLDVRDTYLGLVKRLVLGFGPDVEFERAYVGVGRPVQEKSGKLDNELVRVLALASCKKASPSEASMESWVPDWRILNKFESDSHKEAVDLILLSPSPPAGISFIALKPAGWKLDIAHNGYHYLRLQGTLLERASPSRKDGNDNLVTWAPTQKENLSIIRQQSNAQWPQPTLPTDRIWLAGRPVGGTSTPSQIIAFVLRAGRKTSTFRETPVYHLHSCFVTDFEKALRKPFEIEDLYIAALDFGKATDELKEVLASRGVYMYEEFYLE